MGATFTPVKRSALHEVHQALGAVWVEEAGWQRPRAYAAPEAEAARVRAGVGLLDESPLGKLALRGRDAAAVVGGSGNGAGRSNGLARRLRLDGDGPAVSTLALPLAPDELLLLTAPGEVPTLAARLAPRLAGCAHLTDLTSALAALRLAGPRAPELLPKLFALDLAPRAFPNLAVAQAPLAEVRAVVVRDDVGPHQAYLVLVPRDLAEYIWQAICEAGRDVGLAPVGAAALTRLGPE